MIAARNPVWRAFALAALRLSALFALVFYGADWLTATLGARWQFYFDWEAAIPYWPAAYLVYLSVFAVPLLVLALAREATQVRRWEQGMALAIAVAGVVFVAMPAQLGYAPADAGAWQLLADLTRAVAGHHNLLPSLHAGLSVLTLRTVWPWVDRGRRALLLGWAALLLPSVLLTHQHHVADLLSGAVLGWVFAGTWWRPRRE